MILDQFKRLVKPKPKTQAFKNYVVSIRDRWSSYPSSGLAPDTLGAIFRQADLGDVSRQAELFEEMEEKDTHLSAELLKRKNAVNSLDFDIVPYEEGAKTSIARGRGRRAKSDKVADFCRDVIFAMTGFEESLFDLLDAIGKGFAMSWIKWEISGGKAVVTDLEWVHQKRLSFVQDFVPRLITDQNLYGEEIAPFQTIYHRHKARSGYDTRAGLLRVCAWMYLFKNYAIKDWVAFAEVFGMPLRIGKYESGATKDDKDALVAAIQALGSDAAGIISKNTEIEFVEAVKKGGSTDNVYKSLSDFCNREISKAIIGATLTTDVGESGSYAASKTHNEVRLDLVKSDCWSLANTLRTQLLRPLVGFNFGWDTPAPWFQFYLQEPEDLKILSDVYRNVVDMGQPVAAEHVSDRFGIPLPEEGQTILTPARPAGPLAMKRVVAKPGQDQFSQDDVDDLSHQGAIDAGDAVSGLLGPVLEAIEGAKSYEEIGEAIYRLYPAIDSAGFQELLARAMFAAGLTGYGAAKGEEE